MQNMLSAIPKFPTQIFTNKHPKGIILYKGKSLLDNERIVVVATGFKEASKNDKTGEMIQVWILRADIPPVLAKRLGEDKSICGDCKHRDAGTCYVNVGQAPAHVYNAYIDGTYQYFNEDMLNHFEGKSIRLGAYGDPAAVPIPIWHTICGVASGWTGYTHQWRNKKLRDIEALKQYCMASVDMVEEKRLAEQQGWRTFRIRTDKIDNFVMPNEFVCPASTEGGYKSNCAKCKGCSGLHRLHQKSAVIFLHGKGCDPNSVWGDWMVQRWERLIKAIRYKKKWRKDWFGLLKKFKTLTKL
jgi:hypothetical protein